MRSAGLAGGSHREMDRGRWYSKALLVAVAVLLLPSAVRAECRLAILGDSLTAGYGVAAGDAFPVRLEAALAKTDTPCTVVDAGVSGDTSAGGAARVDWVLADKPTHLMVELGGNDALRGLPPKEMEANLRHIIEAAVAAKVPVMLAGMLAPPNLGRDYGDAFAAVFGHLAEQYRVPLYPFFLDGVAGNRDLIQEDGIHPNRAGVEVIVERITPTVSRWLQDQD